MRPAVVWNQESGMLQKHFHLILNPHPHPHPQTKAGDDLQQAQINKKSMATMVE